MYLNHVVNKMLISGFGNSNTKNCMEKKEAQIAYSYFQKLSASLLPLPQTLYIHYTNFSFIHLDFCRFFSHNHFTLLAAFSSFFLFFFLAIRISKYDTKQPVRPSFAKSVCMSNYCRILSMLLCIRWMFKTHMQRRGLPHCWLNPRKL